MKSPRFIFWLIVVLTILALYIDLPKEFTLFGKKFSAFSPNFSIGSLHVKKDFSIRRGLDLEGGVSITYKAKVEDLPSNQRNDALESIKNVIERRINFFGVSEPVVQTATVNNESRIIVEIPGISNVDEALSLIGTTAQLTFWEEGASNSAKMKQATSSALPYGLTQFLGPIPKKTDLSGKDLQKAGITFNTNTGVPEVSLKFSNDGAKKFADITKRNLNKPVAIVLDDVIISAPRVNVPITDGNAVITGGFTTEQAKNLSIQLNAGALPVPLTILEQQTIGPTLGEKSLKQSLFAGAIGFVVIVVFMVVLYGRFGVIASIALLLYTIFTLALFKAIPVTLTLAGIAGFILSIGMAVDANILIFERLREELRSGRNLSSAIELGFTRAWSSIRDSNISSLITSFILYYFGTGIVKNFAFTLAIGVLVSMFSAIVVTRTFLRLVYR
ncbi:MAG: protein translocase subunit SecD [Candidatus Levyibacteriota bacterium]|nr:MAG: protein translocase subunit SecD [Candidatus Levybacteria bacterium]